MTTEDDSPTPVTPPRSTGPAPTGPTPDGAATTPAGRAAAPRRADDAFRTTRWSLVAAAAAGVAGADGDDTDARAALEDLCRTYWLPLHAYVRRRVADRHEAQDLTQSFFTRLLERNDFAAARADRGRFRAYLLTALKHHLANARDRVRAAKRGGGRAPLSLDFDTEAGRLRWEPGDPTTPEQAYEREWATTVLARVFERLRAEAVAADQRAALRADLPADEAPEAPAAAPIESASTETSPAGEHVRRFDALKPFLAGAARGAYARVAAELGLSESAARTAAGRLRDRYRELLRDEIAQTVADASDPTAIDAEIAALFAAVRPAPRIL